MLYNILVTGANGQLGQSLKKIYNQSKNPHYRLFNTDIDTLDITNFDAVEKFIVDNKINCIINTAAYTAVEKAETDIEKAFLLNATAVDYLSQLVKKHQLLLVHISTDYVFDGESSVPYTPDVPTNPISVYGKSKAEGEHIIFEKEIDAVIIRTSWLYSSYGNNFVKTILRLAKERDSLTVINNQFGAPTSATDLATAIFSIIEQRTKLSGTQIYHYANEGIISWYEFAKEIIQIANINCKISPIGSEDYPSKVQRPQYSVFNLSKIKNQFGIKIPTWKKSLEIVLKELGY